MGGAVIAGVAVVMLTMVAYSQMISGQKARNNRLTAEIVELEKSIEEIDGLERQKESVGRGRPDQRGAADAHDGDRFAGAGEIRERPDLEAMGQARLVDDAHAPLVILPDGAVRNAADAQGQSPSKSQRQCTS